MSFESKNLSKNAKIGSNVKIGWGLDVSANSKELKIVSIQLHSDFDIFLQSSNFEPLDVSDLKDVNDIAIVEVDQSFDEIQSADLSIEYFSTTLEHAIVAGYGLSSDPFIADQSAQETEPKTDLFWNRFRISKIDHKRFYADSRDYGAGTDIVKLLAADLGAPVFLEEKRKSLGKLIGIASGSDFNKESYFVKIDRKTLSCLKPALRNPSKKVSGREYAVFCKGS